MQKIRSDGNGRNLPTVGYSCTWQTDLDRSAGPSCRFRARFSTPGTATWKPVFPPRPELRVALAGRELCHPDYAMARETFPCHALEFVAGGTGELVLNGESYPLHAGVIFVYGPASPHKIVNRSTCPMTKYFVDFLGGEVEAMLRQSSPRAGPCRADPGGRDVAIALRAIDRRRNEERRVFQTALRGVPASDSPQGGGGDSARVIGGHGTLGAVPAMAGFHRGELLPFARPGGRGR